MASGSKDLVVKAVLKARDAMSGPVRRASMAVRRTLTPALRTARGAASGLVGVVGKLSSGLSLLGIGGVAVSGAGILKLASDHAKALDELGKFSRQVGFNVEALGEYDYAAARQGVATDQLRAGLRTLNTRLGQARAGYGDLATFMKQLPPAFQKQVKAAGSTEEVFDLVLKAMTKIKDPAKRAALAAKFFGEEAGPKLGRLAEAGADGIEALRKEARKYGVATKEQTDAAEAFVDTQENLNRTVSGLKMRIGSALLPVLRPLLERMTDWISANKDLLAQKVSAWVQDLVTWLQEVDWSAIADGARDVWEAVQEVFGLVQRFVEQIGGWGNALVALFAVRLAGALGGLPGLIVAGTAVAIASLVDVMKQLDGFEEWRRKQENSAVRAGAEQRSQVRAALNKRITNQEDVTNADVRTAAAVGLLYDRQSEIFRGANPFLQFGQLALQAAAPQATAEAIRGAVQVDVRVRNDSDAKVRTDTSATGPVKAKTTTTAPTGRRGVGQTAGAGVAP